MSSNSKERDDKIFEYIKTRDEHKKDNIEQVYSRYGIIITMITIITSFLTIGLEKSIISFCNFFFPFIEIGVIILYSIIALYPFDLNKKNKYPDELKPFDIDVDKIYSVDRSTGKFDYKEIKMEHFLAKAVKHAMHATNRVNGLKKISFIVIGFSLNLIVSTLLYIIGIQDVLLIVLIQIFTIVSIFIVLLLIWYRKKLHFKKRTRKKN